MGRRRQKTPRRPIRNFADVPESARSLLQAWRNHVWRQLAVGYQQRRHKSQIIRALPAMAAQYANELELIDHLAESSRTMYPTHADHNIEKGTFGIEYQFYKRNFGRTVPVGIVFTGRITSDYSITRYHCYPNTTRRHGPRVPIGWE